MSSVVQGPNRLRDTSIMNTLIVCQREIPQHPDSELSHVIDDPNPFVLRMYAEAFKLYFQLQSCAPVITQLKRCFFSLNELCFWCAKFSQGSQP